MVNGYSTEIKHIKHKFYFSKHFDVVCIQYGEEEVTEVWENHRGGRFLGSVLTSITNRLEIIGFIDRVSSENLVMHESF